MSRRWFLKTPFAFAALFATTVSRAESETFIPTNSQSHQVVQRIVHNKALREGRIRARIGEGATSLGFLATSESDTSKGENRGIKKSRQHFSGIRQRDAAGTLLAASEQQRLPEPIADGSVRVPEVLRPYLGGREVLEPVAK